MFIFILMVPHIKGNIFKNIFVCLVQRIPGWETNVYSNTSQSVLSSQDQPLQPRRTTNKMLIHQN